MRKRTLLLEKFLPGERIESVYFSQTHRFCLAGTENGTICRLRLKEDFTLQEEEVFCFRSLLDAANRKFPGNLSYKVHSLGEGPWGQIAVGTDLLTLHCPHTLALRRQLLKPREYFHLMRPSPDRQMLLVKHGNPAWTERHEMFATYLLVERGKSRPLLQTKITLFRAAGSAQQQAWWRRSFFGGSMIHLSFALWLDEDRILVGPCHRHGAAVYSVSQGKILLRIPAFDHMLGHVNAAYSREQNRVFFFPTSCTATRYYSCCLDEPEKIVEQGKLPFEYRYTFNYLDLFEVDGAVYFAAAHYAKALHPPGWCKVKFFSPREEERITSVYFAPAVRCLLLGTSQGRFQLWRIEAR